MTGVARLSERLILMSESDTELLKRVHRMPADRMI